MEKKYRKRIGISTCILIVAILVNLFVWNSVPQKKSELIQITDLSEQYEQQIKESLDIRRKTTYTKLLKMDPFIETVNEYLEGEHQENEIAALVAMDGDKISLINQMYGAGAGNEFILRLAETLKKDFPENDNNIVCNVGEKSDEIYILLKGRNSVEEIAKEIADFQQDLRDNPVIYRGEDIKASCSAGIAIYPRDGEVFQELYEAADAALYNAKENGRDTYFVYGADKAPERATAPKDYDALLEEALERNAKAQAEAKEAADTALAAEAEIFHNLDVYAVLPKDEAYNSKELVALYIHQYGKLPSNFITKDEAATYGWDGGSVAVYAPGKSIGGDEFVLYEELEGIVQKEGRKYYECDINTLGNEKRGAERIIFSNDGMVYYTPDHYNSFELLYSEE